MDDLPGPVALVLSGGGAQGAAQAGAAVALRRAGLVPDLIIGTSVGAWNGGWLARSTSEENARGLLAMWLDGDVRCLFRGLVRGFVGAVARRRIAALGDARLRRILDRTLGGGCTFAELETPMACAAIDLLTAELVYLDSGSLADAVRAASAIPAVLPPVELDGRLLADAGFVDNFGVVEALRRGARSIVLIDASVGQLDRAPHSIPSMLDRANLVTRIHQRQQASAAAEAAGAPLAILEVAGNGGVLDFKSAAGQLAYGREVAERWLAGAGATAAWRRAAVAGEADAGALDVAGRPVRPHRDVAGQLVPA
ncbi:MAG TPA: patatin-like phospholipase family protein [Candidatus Dormibacteraeota bacterium]|nr:patatin-like phospholipase family protein [Candidatus Dormibacteraeota bacterium]